MVRALCCPGGGGGVGVVGRCESLMKRLEVAAAGSGARMM